MIPLVGLTYLNCRIDLSYNKINISLYKINLDRNDRIKLFMKNPSI
ncbi:hypothetical protein LSO9J_10076 [Candidatus Liberibacter solanacearum]